MQDSKQLKERIIAAGRIAVEQLIKVAQEDILKPGEDDDLAADRLKNAAATKKLAIFDALEILNRIDSEEEALAQTPSRTDSKVGFAERRSR
jgi:hypothetical protein